MRPEHGAPGVTGNGRAREAGQLLVSDDDGVLHRVGHRAQARAQDDADARRGRRARCEGRSCLCHAFSSATPNDSGSSSPSVVVVSSPR